MKFLDLAHVLSGRPCFTELDVRLMFPGSDGPQLHYWQQKGYVERLRKPWYRLTPQPWSQFERRAVADRMISPSYISLGSALSYHGLIPEGVFHITSITTTHTRVFDIGRTRYFYRNVKPALYFGYDIIEQEAIAVRMADVEKTPLDVLYYDPKLNNATDLQALRSDRTGLRDPLHMERFQNYLILANNKALSQRAERLTTWIHDQPR